MPECQPDAGLYISLHKPTSISFFLKMTYPQPLRALSEKQKLHEVISDNVKNKQTEMLTVVDTNYQFAMEISMSSLNNAIASRLRAGQATNKVSNHKRMSFLSPLL